MLFVLFRKVTWEKILPQISPYGGTVMHSSLTPEAEARLLSALTQGGPATESGSEAFGWNSGKPDQNSTQFPHIPGVAYSGFKTTRYLLEIRAEFLRDGNSGDQPAKIQPRTRTIRQTPRSIRALCPRPMPTATTLQVFVCRRSGPLATYTGWALRATPKNNDGHEGSGQYIPFAGTKADRLSSGDPRCRSKSVTRISRPIPPGCATRSTISSGRAFCCRSTRRR
jgi:hypothetical protein